MEVTKIYLEVPNELHVKVRQIQLDEQIKGGKRTLKDIYYDVIREGLRHLKP